MQCTLLPSGPCDTGGGCTRFIPVKHKPPGDPTYPPQRSEFRVETLFIRFAHWASASCFGRRVESTFGVRARARMRGVMTHFTLAVTVEGLRFLDLPLRRLGRAGKNLKEAEGRSCTFLSTAVRIIQIRTRI